MRNIRARVLLISLVVAVGLGSLSLFNHYNATRVRQAQAALDQVEFLRSFEDRIENALHLVKRLQPRANSAWTKVGTQRHATAMAQLDSLLAAPESTTATVTESLAEARDGFSAYRQRFEEFMRLHIEIGDSQGSGHAAKLFGVRTELRESIYSTLDADLLAAWEKVSLAEQNYQAVPVASNAEKFQASVDSVRRITNVLWLSFESRRAVLAQIGMYEAALENVMQKQIGLNRLQDEVEQAFDRTLIAMALMRSTLHTMADSANNSLAQAWQTTDRSAVSGSIVIIIATTLVCLMIGTRVSARIGSMTVAMRALAKGDTGLAIPALGDADEIGDMARAVEVFRDNAVALRESETRYQAVVEDQTEMISRYTPDGIRTFVNDAYCRFHGKSRDRLLGRSAYEELAPEDLDRLKALEAGLNLENPAGEFEVCVPGPDGKTIWQLWMKRAIFDASGRITEIQAVGRDITERKRAGEQFRQAQKMEAVGQLTAGVAHDFNNMLAVIWGNAELLTDDLGEDNPQLTTLIQATKRAAELTQRLLAFSRKQVLHPKVINANNLIADITGLLRRTLEEHIEIETVTAAGLWNCEVDPAQLENALVNLAVNARDAMPDGGKLTIDTGNARLDDDYAAAQADVKPGQYVMLAVSDTGTGMSAEVREHVLEPFFSTKAAGSGSGLGLSMVYGFVKQSGGHVTIYSEAGEGTTIKLYLPRSTETVAVDRKPATDEVPVARGETVLVVEDDPDVRTLAVTLLGKLGYLVMEAAAGATALEQLGSTAGVNLLLTDVVLTGGMNGRGLAMEAERCAPGIKVLYMSGYTEDAIVHHGRLDADAELLQKPFRRADLARAVRKVLDGGSAMPSRGSL